jgi:hypothetical protein
MSLPTNNKKSGTKANANQNNQAKGSKFIKGAGSAKQVTITKKVRSTGANRGS